MQTFFEAIDSGETRAVEYMLQLDPSLVHAEDTEGLRPLMRAASSACRSVSCVDVLLRYGANPKLADAEGYTALHYLIDVSAPVDADESLGAIVDHLVQAGADIEARQLYGWTPLLRAIIEGTPNEVRALLRAGANPNVALPSDTLPAFLQGRTALMAALALAQPEMVRALIEHGAEVQGHQGVMTLEYAKELGEQPSASEDYRERLAECVALLQAAQG